MEKEKKTDEKEEIEEAIELILFHVSECYVYLVLPLSIRQSLFSLIFAEKSIKFPFLGYLLKRVLKN